MAENDRVDQPSKNLKIPKPEVEIIVSGESIYKPGMKSYVISPADKSNSTKQIMGSKGYIVGGTTCTCDTVSTSTSKPPSSGGGGGTGRCTCNKICTCNKVT